MLTLVIDAAAGRCAVGLFDGETPLAERSEEMVKGHAEALFPMLREALEHAGLKPKDIQRIAVCTGPGNMTGARIGCAAARGLALTTGAAAIGVSRFEAALDAFGDPGGGATCVALEGRGGTVHVARYEAGAEAAAAQTLRPEDADAMAAGARVIGDVAERLGGARATPEPPLLSFARVAARKAASKPGRPAPLYLKPVAAAPSSATPPPMLP